MPKPSASTVAKARIAAAFADCKKGREYCRPVSITPHQVVFRYGGYEVTFVYDRGRVLRVGTDSHYVYLSVEDFAILHTQAGDLMQAAWNGIKKTPAVQRQRMQNVQLELPLASLPAHPENK